MKLKTVMSALFLSLTLSLSANNNKGEAEVQIPLRLNETTQEDEPRANINFTSGQIYVPQRNLRFSESFIWSLTFSVYYNKYSQILGVSEDKLRFQIGNTSLQPEASVGAHIKGLIFPSVVILIRP